MRTIQEKIEGDFVASEDTDLYGMILGNITVQSGIHFNIIGTVDGDLTVQKGAKALLHGTLNGNIYNHEGFIDIFGRVCGVIKLDTGSIRIDAKATIGEPNDSED